MNNTKIAITQLSLVFLALIWFVLVVVYVQTPTACKHTHTHTQANTTHPPPPLNLYPRNLADTFSRRIEERIAKKRKPRLEKRSATEKANSWWHSPLFLLINWQGFAVVTSIEPTRRRVTEPAKAKIIAKQTWRGFRCDQMLGGWRRHTI